MGLNNQLAINNAKKYKKLMDADIVATSLEISGKTDLKEVNGFGDATVNLLVGLGINSQAQLLDEWQTIEWEKVEGVSPFTLSAINNFLTNK